MFEACGIVAFTEGVAEIPVPSSLTVSVMLPVESVISNPFSIFADSYDNAAFFERT